MMAEYRPATVGAALAEFAADLLIAKAPKTVRNYGYQLKRLDRALPLCDFDRALCRRLLTDSMRTHAVGSTRTFHAVLSAFASFCLREGFVEVSPMKGVRKPPKPEQAPSALSQRQLEALAAACETPRQTLILALLCGTGLRRAELANARWEDIDWERRALTVIGKGRKRRVVLLPRDALTLLSSTKLSCGAILGVCDETIYRDIKRIGRRAGLPWLRPHQLRHTWATSWLLKGGSAFHLQTLGGWSDMTMIRHVYGKAAVEQAALDEARRMDDAEGRSCERPPK